ncbi:MAG: bacteriohemerythrin [Sporomusaceae bacterium]|nr:bacteriohemerythrin [Sporomusaceae bacterium]
MFEWKPEYTSGIEEVDRQHQKLFVLAGDLYDIAKRRDGYDYYDEIVQVFSELSDYTVYHFRYEEEMMKKHGYGLKELAAHCGEHDAFIQKMKKVAAEDLDKRQQQVVMDVVMFAVDWIEQHILGSDRKYADYHHASQRK